MDGEYEIRPRLARDLNESMPRYPEAQQLEVSIDGERVGLFTLPGVQPPASAVPRGERVTAARAGVRGGAPAASTSAAATRRGARRACQRRPPRPRAPAAAPDDAPIRRCRRSRRYSKACVPARAEREARNRADENVEPARAGEGRTARR